MSTKIDRNIVVTHGAFCVVVGFHWNEEGEGARDERKALYIECVSQEMENEANQVIPVLFADVARVTVDGETVSIMSRDFDQQPKLFDLIVDSTEPERV